MAVLTNTLGGELRARPITLPKLALPDLDIEAEAKEAAARVAEQCTIRAGRDAWALIGKAQLFEAWKAIGAALAVGEQYALKVTGANRAWGRSYSHCFSRWMKQHGFDATAKSVRSVAIELHENLAAIEA